MNNKVHTESIKGASLLLSIVVLGLLGVRYPEQLGLVAVAGLSSVIGGYYGNAQPGKDPDNGK